MKFNLSERANGAMIKSIGIDAVELPRIKKILARSPHFAKKVLTLNEYQQFTALSEHRQVEYFAGRFCCKEAFAKAWGTGIGKVKLQEIEVLANEQGAPVMTKSPHQGKAFVSITHTESLAIAQVILEEGVD